MTGYVPQILPASYIETRAVFSGFSDSAPPLVQASGEPAPTGPSGGFLSIIGGLLGGAFKAGTTGSQEFNVAVSQLNAQRIANERSRRWGTFGAVAVGIAGLAGVVYLLRK